MSQTCLSESSLWYRKRPGKRTKAAPVLVQETEADTAAAAKAAALLRSEYGRGAIAAYVQGWLGESDVCRSEDIPLKNDKDYVMSLLAVLTGGDRSADFTVQELDGERRENGYAIPELQISRKRTTNEFGISNTATAKELEQFKAVCNQLLSRTYVVRTLYRPGRGRVSNPDYTFLSIHYESVREYLSLLDWDLRRDDINGYFYVLNTDEANRCILSKRETAILLALRMLYDESQERLGLEQDALAACARCSKRS